MKKDMKEHLNIDVAMIEKMTNIKRDYIEGKTDYETTKALIKQNFTKITPAEFAYSEQKIKDLGFDDNTVHDKMNDVLGLFDDIIVREAPDLPEGHPISTYLMENFVIKELIAEMKEEADKKFIKNKWLELYDKLYKFNIHLSRKQHQLFSMLERKGFDRPSRIMWSFDNAVRDSISKARHLLNEDKIDKFMEQQKLVWELTLDIMNKEEEVLYPTSLKMITEEEFRGMRPGDDEIGYCLIDKPEGFYPETKEEEKVSKENSAENSATQNQAGFMNDLASLLSKYNMGNEPKKENDVLNVKQGKLTLEQINLIYQHMPVDLSFVDENEIVKFYTDTKHRVFPRSAGVIGRDVKNCHPRESVDTVMAIFDAFRKGEQEEAEFWLETNGRFVYITYTAVRDENGKFRGVLEMMQDITKIRSLTGQRRLLMWENPAKKSESYEQKNEEDKSEYGFDKNSVIGDIIDKYPYIKEFMPTLAPEYTKLLDPVQYMIMSKVATLDMIAERGGFTVPELINKIEERIKREERKTGDTEIASEYGLTKDSIIGNIIDKYPYIKEFMPTLSPVYNRLLNPVQYMIMSKVATLDMIAARGGFEVDDLIKKMEAKIREEENK